jgi:hypothetical protein
MNKRDLASFFGKKTIPIETETEQPPDLNLNLSQWMPYEFEETTRQWLPPEETPEATLFIPSTRILEWIPSKALVIMRKGVLCLEEGESVILNQKWGVKSLFYPYRQIASVGIGHALLRGRFILQSSGNAPPFEIILPWYQLNNFRAAARMITDKIAE